MPRYLARNKLVGDPRVIEGKKGCFLSIGDVLSIDFESLMDDPFIFALTPAKTRPNLRRNGLNCYVQDFLLRVRDAQADQLAPLTAELLNSS